MGCGASETVTLPTTNTNGNHYQQSSANQRQQKLVKAEEKEIQPSRESFTPSSTMANNSTTSSINVLIGCHSDQHSLGEQFRTACQKSALNVYLLTESQPKTLGARANLIRWCDVYVVLISTSYKRTMACMEIINYANELRKSIITVQAEKDFRPYADLGAIAASSLKMINLDENSPSNGIAETVNLIGSKVKKGKQGKNVIDPAKVQDEVSNTQLGEGTNNAQVLICTANDGLKVAELVYNGLQQHKSGTTAIIENLSTAKSSSVSNCSVFVPIISPQFEENLLCQATFEKVRQLNIPVVPVVAIPKFKPEDWLGLPIAGKVYFRLFDAETANKPFWDSTRMKDFVYSVQSALLPVPTDSVREEKEIEYLNEKLNECKSKLKTWPPPRKQQSGQAGNRKPVKVQLEEPKSTHDFIHIHHEITRMERKPPPALIDEYGVPIRRKFDCMISYQWDFQSLVRKIYEDFNMRTLKTWFDIWGAMMGSTTMAMATGVECSKVILVFLSKSYAESANCQLEFRYAIYRGKPFVVIKTEPNIQLEQWMSEAIEGFPQYNVYDYEQVTALINGVPLIDVITQAIRKLGLVQPNDVVNDCSKQVLDMRNLLDDALDEISQQSGKQRFQKCTRCGGEFDDFSKSGCKKHRAYYVGGSLIEGRWVCCREQSTDSPGCEDCDHISEPRKCVQDSYYGTWTWEPA
ncbi:unnamed protein product [Didymodactylos carnosus]|uniref:TIR domain-containing protein n=1 Tax=Didymodactylos carnosus TaxID=1234261 RepID=A0A815HSB5_9BILA|nr:unnamed protein product [Didymodactylos carnosus]CAF1356421.1 unnamed protein product [Didymodactylos carnosus]CAF4027256.1 unnamed protein product [Didymodactylos carnosus]CAF4230562.1 unnamed protein product [Didymodactylos carnosus]